MLPARERTSSHPKNSGLAKNHQSRCFPAKLPLLWHSCFQLHTAAERVAHQLHLTIVEQGAPQFMRISKIHSAFFTFAVLATVVSGQQTPARPPVEGQPQDSTTSRGGWRRVTDPPPAAATAPIPEQEPVGPPMQDQGVPAPPPPGYSASAGAPGGGMDAYGQSREAYPNPQGQPPQGAPGPYRAPNTRYQQIPPELTIRPGTYLTVRVDQPLSSDRSHAGDAFSATLVKPLVIDGVIVAQSGQLLGGRVVEAQKAGRVEGVSRLAVELIDIPVVDGQQLPIKSALVSRTGPTSEGRDAGAIVGTTALGAAAGAIADGGFGAAVGAGAGAFVGLIGVLTTRGHATMIYPESVLTFRVETPVTISTTRAPQAFRFVDPQDYQRADAMQQRYRAQAAPPQRYGFYGGPGYGYGPAYYPYYPYYWGPSFSFFYGGPRYYGRGFYSRGYGYRRR